MTQRQDARRNRELLLSAAEAVFREHGMNIPLQLVAERAGVGRGTLYRHFPDREQLAQAIIEGRLAQIERQLQTTTDVASTVQEIFFLIADILSAIPELFQYLASSGPGLETLMRLRHRLDQLLAAPIEEARTQGRLREAVTFQDFHIGWAMLQGSMLIIPQQDRAQVTARARVLLGAALFTQVAERGPGLSASGAAGRAQ